MMQEEELGEGEDEQVLFSQGAANFDDEEEEELWNTDHTTLLTNQEKDLELRPARKQMSHCLKVFETISLCAAFFGLGLCIAIPGPTLLDLQQQTNTDTETISRIFTGRSVGYLIGTVVSGLLFDYVNQVFLLIFALLLTALGTAFAPLCSSFALLVLVISFQGVSMGFLDTGGNVMCLHIWGDSNGPWMQALHFAFGVGAFVAPLLAEPFLSTQLSNDTMLLSNQSFSPDFTTLAPVYENIAGNMHLNHRDFSYLWSEFNENAYHKSNLEKRDAHRDHEPFSSIGGQNQMQLIKTSDAVSERLSFLESVLKLNRKRRATDSYTPMLEKIAQKSKNKYSKDVKHSKTGEQNIQNETESEEVDTYSNPRVEKLQINLSEIKSLIRKTVSQSVLKQNDQNTVLETLPVAVEQYTELWRKWLMDLIVDKEYAMNDKSSKVLVSYLQKCLDLIIDRYHIYPLPPGINSQNLISALNDELHTTTTVVAVNESSQHRSAKNNTFDAQTLRNSVTVKTTGNATDIVQHEINSTATSGLETTTSAVVSNTDSEYGLNASDNTDMVQSLNATDVHYEKLETEDDGNAVLDAALTTNIPFVDTQVSHSNNSAFGNVHINSSALVDETKDDLAESDEGRNTNISSSSTFNESKSDADFESKENITTTSNDIYNHSITTEESDRISTNNYYVEDNPTDSSERELDMAALARDITSGMLAELHTPDNDARSDTPSGGWTVYYEKWNMWFDNYLTERGYELSEEKYQNVWSQIKAALTAITTNAKTFPEPNLPIVMAKPREMLPGNNATSTSTIAPEPTPKAPASRHPDSQRPRRPNNPLVPDIYAPGKTDTENEMQESNNLPIEPNDNELEPKLDETGAFKKPAPRPEPTRRPPRLRPQAESTNRKPRPRRPRPKEKQDEETISKRPRPGKPLDSKEKPVVPRSKRETHRSKGDVGGDENTTDTTFSQSLPLITNGTEPGTTVLSSITAQTTTPGIPPKAHPKSAGGTLNEDSNVASGKILKNVKTEKPKPPTTTTSSTTTTKSSTATESFEDEFQDVTVSDSEDAESKEVEIVPSTTTTTTTTTTTSTTTTTTTTTTTPTTTTTTSLPTRKSSIHAPSTKIAEINIVGEDNNVNDTSMVNETESDNTVKTKITEVKQRVETLIKDAEVVLYSFSKVQFAYLAIALYIFVVALLFMVLCCAGKCTLRAYRVNDTSETLTKRRESPGFRIQILVLLFIFYFLYVGMEVTYGGFLMTFTVEQLGWSKARGTMVTSVFWGSFAAGRGLAIFLARCCIPPVMLIKDLIITNLTLIVLVMALDSNPEVIWYASALLGIGMAAIFPTGITWAERYMEVTGKATAVFVVGSALGEMFMPALTGFLFENKSPLWLLYLMLGSAILSVVVYIIMQNLASNSGLRYNEQKRYRRTDLSDSELDLEMDSLALNVDLEDDSHPLVPGSQQGRKRQSNKRVTFDLTDDAKSARSRLQNKVKGSILKVKSAISKDA